MTNKEIEQRLINLENAFIQSQKNNNNTIDKVNNNRVDINSLTPYMDSKRAYIGDTTCLFNNVRTGNITAYCEYDSGVVVQITSINRISDTVTIGFEPLEEVATVTISVL